MDVCGACVEGVRNKFLDCFVRARIQPLRKELYDLVADAYINRAGLRSNTNERLLRHFRHPYRGTFTLLAPRPCWHRDYTMRRMAPGSLVLHLAIRLFKSDWVSASVEYTYVP